MDRILNLQGLKYEQGNDPIPTQGTSVDPSASACSSISLLACGG